MNRKNTAVVLVTIICLITAESGIHATPVVRADNFQLTILHNNDMHARFVETDGWSNRCSNEAAINHKCYGGFARVAYLVRKYRNESENVLFLNAGDTYTGTPWFSLFKSNITTKMMNILKPDAISLGNHEFDEGVEGLVPFLEKADFPILAANLDLSHTPDMQNLPSLKASQIFTRGGRQIGIIGYLTPDTKQLVAAMSVDFTPEIAAINAEAEKLAATGVDIIIALGHSGILEDQNIALNCPLVDVVIGGHSHTFLFSGVAAEDTAYGPYPIVITQASGKKVPVVQAYAFTKYLGLLSLQFNEAGDLLFWEGQPIILNDDVPQEDDVALALEEFRSDVEAYETSVIGTSKVILQASNCRKSECNMGNMIADGMVHTRASLYEVTGDEHWTDAAIALMQGGGVRGTIDTVSNGGTGDITMGELDTVLPFRNKLMVVEISGKVLKDVLEFSVSNYVDKELGVAAFLQVSGVHVSFNLDQPANSRIEELEVLCRDCEVPRYSAVEDSKLYGVIISDFMKNGGDGFTMFSDAKVIFEFPADDIDIIKEYITRVSPIYTPLESRVQVKGSAAVLSASFLLLAVSAVLNLWRL